MNEKKESEICLLPLEREQMLFLVEQVDPATTAQIDAAIPIPCNTEGSRAAVNLQSRAEDTSCDLLHEVTGRGVIDDRDLHLLRAGILLSNAEKGLLQIRATPSRGYHDRPERALCVVRNRFDGAFGSLAHLWRNAPESAPVSR